MEIDEKGKKDLKVDGFIEKGTQYDVDIIVPEDNRNVIYGKLKNQYHKPLHNAVIKLIEVSKDFGKKKRIPITHTFTDKDGEFVFGPLCPDKHYEIQVWYNDVKHVKINKECTIKQECLEPDDDYECNMDMLPEPKNNSNDYCDIQ